MFMPGLTVSAVEDANLPEEVRYSHILGECLFQYRIPAGLAAVFLRKCRTGYVKTDIEGKEYALKPPVIWCAKRLRSMKME